MNSAQQNTPIIVSIQVGQPQIRHAPRMDDDRDRAWESAIFKQPVTGPVWLGRLNLRGDAQADLQNHGGPDRPILAYCAGHYTYWRATLPDITWAYGGFGENLTVTHLNEQEVCIGDVYAIGPARVQVSQPRQPCWKLARRWNQTDLTARVQQTGYSGWYMRVLQEGTIEAGMALELLERPYPEWTIVRTTAVLRASMRDADVAAGDGARLAACPALSDDWRGYLTDKARKAIDRL